MQIDEAAVIQMLAPVLDEPACAVALKNGGHIRLNAADLHHLIKRVAEQEREACKAAIESCVNELGFGGGSPGRWMADQCLRAISERNKEKT